MKTILTLLIAVLSFATTLAWAGEERNHAPGSASSSASNTPRATVQQRLTPAAAGPQAQPLGSPSATAPAKAGQPAATHPKRAGGLATRGAPQPGPAGFPLELPAAGPSVICACVMDRSLG